MKRDFVGVGEMRWEDCVRDLVGVGEMRWEEKNV